MALNPKIRKQLKQIAHHLHPALSVGEQGLSPAVLAEAERALDDHELIKVRFHHGDRDLRRNMGADLAAQCNAEIVQNIGKVFVLYRASAHPNPALSNVTRFADGD